MRICFYSKFNKFDLSFYMISFTRHAYIYPFCNEVDYSRWLKRRRKYQSKQEIRGKRQCDLPVIISFSWREEKDRKMKRDKPHWATCPLSVSLSYGTFLLAGDLQANWEYGSFVFLSFYSGWINMCNRNTKERKRGYQSHSFSFIPTIWFS